jgi:hypothetical protein
MMLQHVDAYLTLLGVDEFSSELAQMRQSAQRFGSQDAIAALETKVVRAITMLRLSGALLRLS